MGYDAERARRLRELADAIEKLEAARRFPGISCPNTIKFSFLSSMDGTVRELTSFGDNATLLDAIKQEIALEWDDIRASALRRLEEDVKNLTRSVAHFIGAKLDEEAA